MPTKFFAMVGLIGWALLGLGTAPGAVADNGACPAPAADYGKVVASVGVASGGTYRLWAHMQAHSAAANSFMLQVDSVECHSMGGGASMVPNAWTWVDYADGNTAVPIDLGSLAPGTHTLTLLGTAPGVAVDDILLASNTSCVPAGDGSNCGNVSTPVASSGAAVASRYPAPSGQSVAMPERHQGWNWMQVLGIFLIVLGLAGGGLLYAHSRGMDLSRLWKRGRK